MRSLIVRAARAAGWIVVGVIVIVIGQPARLSAAQDTAPAEVSEAQARAFAAELERNAIRGDMGKLNAQIDWEAILAESVRGIEVSDSLRENFLKGARSGLEKSSSLGGTIIAQVKAGSSYRLLRTRLRGKRRTALMRLAFPHAKGVNYHEYSLEPGPDGQVRAVDVYLFLAGELVSQTIRHGYATIAAQENRGVLDRLFGGSPDYLGSLAKVPEMRRLADADKAREAREIYDKLPSAVQDDKNFLLLRLLIAQQLGNTDYSATLERIRKLLPNDPFGDAASIDGYTLLGQYDKALGAIDRFEKAVGGDPYQNVIRVGILTKAGRLDEARESARAAVAGVPGLVQCYWVLLSVALEMNDHALTLTTLEQMNEKFHIKFKDLTTVSGYARFVKSPQFEEWKSYIEKKKPKTQP